MEAHTAIGVAAVSTTMVAEEAKCLVVAIINIKEAVADSTR